MFLQIDNVNYTFFKLFQATCLVGFAVLLSKNRSDFQMQKAPSLVSAPRLAPTSAPRLAPTSAPRLVIPKNLKQYELQDIKPNISFPKIGSGYLKNHATKNASKEKASQIFKVPNLVHYCWYTRVSVPFRFIDYLGFMSAYKILRPDHIYFHLNMEPTGPYWNHVRDLPGVKINRTDWPTTVLGEEVKNSSFYTAGSNLCRNIQIYHHGGIYLDLDVLVVRSFDELRTYSCCLGLEMTDRMCGGIIICERQSMFMKLWANSYLDDYRPQVWAYNTGIKPLQLSRRFPSLVKVLPDKLHRPNWAWEINQLWGTKTWDWKSNFAVHT